MAVLGFALDVQRVPQHRVGYALVPVLLLNAFLSNYERVDLSNNRVAERYGLDILEDLPKGAVLITEGDDVAFILTTYFALRKSLTSCSIIARGVDQTLSPVERRLPVNSSRGYSKCAKPS